MIFGVKNENRNGKTYNKGDTKMYKDIYDKEERLYRFYEVEKR